MNIGDKKNEASKSCFIILRKSLTYRLFGKLKYSGKSSLSDEEFSGIRGFLLIVFPSKPS